ncbi:MAG: 50S ribosomal protein L32 [Phycisphaeraceae bacterium]|nr:50S ribosomal protein L32 [Phycisphaeraceae bacterium]MCW5754126.1 50S ribosomal protein L32 [Phycisphaeraceae bacterium]
MLPPQRVSHSRSRLRRSHHALTAETPTTCPDSGAPKLPHKACSVSGYVRPGLKIRVPKLKIGTNED